MASAIWIIHTFSLFLVCSQVVDLDTSSIHGAPFWCNADVAVMFCVSLKVVKPSLFKVGVCSSSSPDD